MNLKEINPFLQKKLRKVNVSAVAVMMEEQKQEATSTNCMA